MAKFSERVGAVPPRPFQLNTMDSALRVALWNWLLWALGKEASTSGWTTEYWYKLAKTGLWDEILHKPADEVDFHNVQKQFKLRFFELEWYDVYDAIEWIVPRVNTVRNEYDRVANLETQLNHVLEREMSAYRMVNGHIVEVTSPVEISEIQKAATARSGCEGVSVHIQSALACLGQKPDPDYRNSVKESISAVEAAVKLLTNEKSGGIDTALKLLDKGTPLHPAFRMALSKLYAYTSDDDGIRHPILEEATVTGAEAKFMLVACSAFANLLIDSSR